MKAITVTKADLLKTLRENREGHYDTFVKAQEIFRKQAAQWFDEQLELVRKGLNPNRVMPLPIPEEHTADYDRAIAMLEWDLSDTFELEEHEFRQYVQDDWGWRQTFVTNTGSYLANQ